MATSTFSTKRRASYDKPVDNAIARSSSNDAASCHVDYPQALCRPSRSSGECGTMKATPKEAATSIRGLTKSTPEPAMSREVSMASSYVIRNHTFPESVLTLPPGEWRLIRGVRRFFAEPQIAVAQVEVGPPRVADCGTPSGYNRHRKLGEDACLDCRRACRDRARRRRAQAAEVAA